MIYFKSAVEISSSKRSNKSFFIGSYYLLSNYLLSYYAYSISPIPSKSTSRLLAYFYMSDGDLIFGNT